MAVKADFAIKIRSAHAYLFHWFLSLVETKRADQYVGSFENGIRLFIDAVQAESWFQ
ncbi:Aldolase-type TIM barrel [Penicillium roqueforti FM164]|uniref:Aldolase-type TIM barrel n=1 Tax=Penicillium roqueforti (strain FM164) TaxID=1365484 RepID=W6QJ07_PENRF|nr:Aldolase-type TIM barrel [Penicillium roqueforti FM164]